MSRPLLLLPLDDRPINLDYPPLLAAVAGEVLLTPPSARLGHFLTPGDTGKLADWLVYMAPDVRSAIVSLDMLAYGGLVASRSPAVPIDDALQSLQALREMKERNPQLKIFAFNVIMRLSITGVDEVTREAWRDIFRYSVLRDQAERLGNASAAKELAEVTARIPPDLLEKYLEARARNHAINRAAIELLGEGVLDFLALVQEDTSPAGLHVTEQQALQALAGERADADCWRLYPGTDEAALTLLARYLLQESGWPFRVDLDFRDSSAAVFPALFEDLPLRETAARHLDAVGGIKESDGYPCGVHTFKPPQPDLFEMPPLSKPTWEAALKRFRSSNVSGWLDCIGVSPLMVADTAYCNGADPRLLHVLLKDGRYWELSGYAGWNTAGNTLGTVFAHAALHMLARSKGFKEEMAAAHERALLVRLLDDGLYQSVVRAWAIKRVEELGLSALNLLSEAPKVEEWVNDAMQMLWKELRNCYPLLSNKAAFRAYLPWGRLFEVGIRFSE